MKQGAADSNYKNYWTALRKRLEDMSLPFSLTTPPADDRYAFALGRTGIKLEAVANSKPNDQWVRVQVSMVGKKAAPLFSTLRGHAAAVQLSIADPIEWAKPGEVPFARITRLESDPFDKKQWPKQHEWIAGRLIRFHEVFSPLIRDLPR